MAQEAPQEPDRAQQYGHGSVGLAIYYDVDNDERVVNVLRVLMKTTDQTPEELP